MFGQFVCLSVAESPLLTGVLEREAKQVSGNSLSVYPIGVFLLLSPLIIKGLNNICY